MPTAQKFLVCSQPNARDFMQAHNNGTKPKKIYQALTKLVGLVRLKAIYPKLHLQFYFLEKEKKKKLFFKLFSKFPLKK